MRDYNRQQLYPYSKMLSSTQVLDAIKDASKLYENWVLPFVTGVPAPPLDSPAVHFGLAFSELYDDRSFDYKTYCREHKVSQRLIDHMGYIIKLFPELPKGCAEFPLIVDHRGWQIRITLDGFLMHNGIIIENKTGQMLWTQEVCDVHPQVTLQVWGHWKKYGKLPKKMMVNWVDTNTNYKKPVETFITKRSVKQLRHFERKVIDPIISQIERGDFTHNPELMVAVDEMLTI